MKTYTIIPTSELTKQLVAVTCQTSVDDVRRSTDGANCILSWRGSTPAALIGKTTYTYAQMRALVTDVDGDWYEEDVVVTPDIP